MKGKTTRGSWKKTRRWSDKKKVEEEKEDKQELWAPLKTLIKEFKNINESKKKGKKY